MTHFIIYQFILFDLGENCAVQNSQALTVLQGELIINFFKKIDDSNTLKISKQKIDNHFGNDSDKAIQFMLESGLIYEEIVKKDYDSILLLTNNELISKTMSFNTQNSEISTKIEFVNGEDEFIDRIRDVETENILVIVFLNPFDYREFIAITDLVRTLNILTTFVFSYNSKLYITNLYQRDWYNPCPKCFFSQLESSLRSEGKMNELPTFQTIVDLLYNKEVLFTSNIPLNFVNVIPTVSQLLKLWTKSNSLNVSANRVVSITLQGEIFYDQAVHWELCDCIE